MVDIPLQNFDDWMKSLGRDATIPELSFQVEFLNADELSWLRETFNEFGPETIEQTQIRARAHTKTLATTALLALLADMKKTTGGTYGACILEEGGALRPAFEQGLWFIGEQRSESLGLQSMLSEVGGMLQQLLMEYSHTVWPACPVHHRPLEARLRNSAALWVCDLENKHYSRLIPARVG